MENTLNLLKNAQQAITEKMREHEKRINGGFIRIIDASLADDYSDFSNEEKDAYMIWEAYSAALLALEEANKKLIEAVEIETESNLIYK